MLLNVISKQMIYKWCLFQGQHRGIGWVHLYHNSVKQKYSLHMHNSSLCAAKSLQSCPTLCDPRDSSAPGSPIPGILQTRTLEWVAISFSSAWKGKVKVKSLSRVRLLVTPWTAAHQAPPSMGFSRQEYWSGVPLPSLLPSLYRHQNYGIVSKISYSILYII